MFYQWQKAFSENGARALNTGSSGRRPSNAEKPAQELEQRLQRKHEAISELMEAQIRLKSGAWEDLKARWIHHEVRDELVDFTRDWPGSGFRRGSSSLGATLRQDQQAQRSGAPGPLAGSGR